MSRPLPQTKTEIRTEFSNRGSYFSLMCAVNNARGSVASSGWCAYARRVMITLGYPSETEFWSDTQTINYAQNIVMIG